MIRKTKTEQLTKQASRTNDADSHYLAWWDAVGKPRSGESRTRNHSGILWYNGRRLPTHLDLLND